MGRRLFKNSVFYLSPPPQISVHYTNTQPTPLQNQIPTKYIQHRRNAANKKLSSDVIGFSHQNQSAECLSLYSTRTTPPPPSGHYALLFLFFPSELIPFVLPALFHIFCSSAAPTHFPLELEFFSPKIQSLYIYIHVYIYSRADTFY